jgi:hypothetical protein
METLLSGLAFALLMAAQVFAVIHGGARSFDVAPNAVAASPEAASDLPPAPPRIIGKEFHTAVR